VFKKDGGVFLESKNFLITLPMKFTVLAFDIGKNIGGAKLGSLMCKLHIWYT
jgi:hypothetical protein